MTAKKNAAAAPDILVANAAIFIEGKPFEAGQPVDGVDKDQLAVAVAARRVGPLSQYTGPKWVAPQPEDSADADDEGQGE